MGLMDVIKGATMRRRETKPYVKKEVVDPYLDSLRRQKQMQDNEEEKKVLKKEIDHYEKERTRKHLYGMRSSGEQATKPSWSGGTRDETPKNMPSTSGSDEYPKRVRPDRLARKEMAAQAVKLRFNRMVKAMKVKRKFEKKLGKLLNQQNKQSPDVNIRTPNAPQVGNILTVNSGFVGQPKQQGSILNTGNSILQGRGKKKEPSSFFGRYQF